MGTHPPLVSCCGRARPTILLALLLLASAAAAAMPSGGPWGRPGAVSIASTTLCPALSTAVFGDGFESSDTCRWSTRLPEGVCPAATCGDSLQTALEACDDGNTTSEVACLYGVGSCRCCSSDCDAVLELTGNVCGDGVTDPANEACDDGNTVSETTCPGGVLSCTACSADCTTQIPLAAPDLATFTATPSPLMPNAPTGVTFSWTYATTPSSPPICAIDAGIGAATSGMQVTIALAQARTFQLRCANPVGGSQREATVAVDECAGGTAECGAHATCTDTTESYTCTCAVGYTLVNGACSAQVDCSSGLVCGSNAMCAGGNTCVCAAGYVGDGLSCTRERLTFVTSTSGSGNLASWAGAAGTGLAAADSICQARAVAAGFPGNFVAWMSDSQNDAYCRVHGATGRKASGCASGLPAAGPWVRTDSARRPAAPVIDDLLAPTRQTFYPVTFTEFGADVSNSAPTLIFTGTDENGELTGSACSDWSTSSPAVSGAMGHLSGGGTAWTDQGTDPSCATTGRLRCVEVGSGPALVSTHDPTARKSFVTSVDGGAILAAWPEAGGSTGIDAADAICRARARYAGYSSAASFKAWISDAATGASSRVIHDGSWYRPDGIQIATGKSTLTSGQIIAPLYETETNAYVAGDAETGGVWTGTRSNGTLDSTNGWCSSWSSTGGDAVIGRSDLADFRWVAFGTSSSSPTLQSCSAPDYRLYCFDDSP